MQHLWDLEGNKYLDFFGGILTVSVGHCNPKISSKVNAQVNRLQHTSTLYPTEHIVALAEKIAQITPGNLQQSFFTNSGRKPTKPPSCWRACPLAVSTWSRCATPTPAAPRSRKPSPRT